MIGTRSSKTRARNRAAAGRLAFWRLVLNRFCILAAALVAVIIHGVATLVVISLIFTPSGNPSGEAQVEIKQLSNMVETYYLASSPRILPERLDDLTAGDNKLTEEVPIDPWGNPYVYVYTGERDFVIFSAGEDGTAGTEDDVFEEGYR